MVEWAYTSAMQYMDCPQCYAKAGNSCRMPSGRRCNYIHSKRFQAYCKSISVEEFNSRHSIKTFTIHELLGKVKGGDTNEVIVE